MEITFLGSGDAFASEGRYWSSFVVDHKYLFDAPPTLLPHLKKLHRPVTELEVIFLSHHHADHFVGLPFLFLEYMYKSPRTTDLFIVGPPGVEAWMEDFADRCYPNISRGAGYKRIYVDAQPGAEQTVGSISFQAIPMNHVKDSMQAMGYRVAINGKSVAYTGDTMYCDEIFELAKGADVLVVDCTYTEGCGPEHMGLDDMQAIRAGVAPETTIVLTHLNGEPSVNDLNNVVAAHDLATFRFD